MTRRILAVLVGLTVLVLAAVVVPLGVSSAAHDRQVFTDRTIAGAAALAGASEEQLADRADATPGDQSVPGTFAYDPALVDRDATAVYDRAQRLVAHGDDRLPVTSTDVGAALVGHTVRRWVAAPYDALLVLRPAYSGSRIVGAAAVLRAAHPLRDQIRDLWLGLGLAGLIAILLATGLGVALARWVGRPLHRLDAAADQLGAGDLAARASSTTGPPEVRQLAGTFNDMAGRLETLIGGHRALVADISHQLRTPLAAVRLRLELLHDDVDVAAGAELEGALSEISRLSRLVDGLLTVARAEHITPVPTAIDLTCLVEERVSIWSALAAERGIRLEVATPIRAAVAATPGNLEQVLDNLLANALDVTPRRGRITLTVTKHKDRLRLEIGDTGPGMTESQRAQAFRRFWSDPAQGAPQDTVRGSGLGLAIVHRLITVDGGSIELDGVPSGGLVVRIDMHPARSDRQRDTAGASPPSPSG